MHNTLRHGFLTITSFSETRSQGLSEENPHLYQIGSKASSSVGAASCPCLASHLVLYGCTQGVELPQRAHRRPNSLPDRSVRILACLLWSDAGECRNPAPW